MPLASVAKRRVDNSSAELNEMAPILSTKEKEEEEHEEEELEVESSAHLVEMEKADEEIPPDCPICLCPLQAPILRPRGCEHLFCKRCLEKSVREQVCCPLDRKPVRRLYQYDQIGGPIAWEIVSSISHNNISVHIILVK